MFVKRATVTGSFYTGNQIESLKHEWRNVVRSGRTLDLPEEFDWDPEHFLYYRARAITADVPNRNGDYFPASEIEKSYHTFRGKGVYYNHDSDSPDKAFGIILDAIYHDTPDDKYVQILAAIDKEEIEKKRPGLLARIVSNKLCTTSMSCIVEECVCSVCGNVARTPEELCPHMNPKSAQYVKGKKVKGSLAYEINKGITFIEDSIVDVPADPTAYIFQVYASYDVSSPRLTEHFKKYSSLMLEAADKPQRSLVEPSSVPELIDKMIEKKVEDRVKQLIDEQIRSKIDPLLQKVEQRVTPQVEPIVEKKIEQKEKEYNAVLKGPAEEKPTESEPEKAPESSPAPEPKEKTQEKPGKEVEKQSSLEESRDPKKVFEALMDSKRYGDAYIFAKENNLGPDFVTKAARKLYDTYINLELFEKAFDLAKTDLPEKMKHAGAVLFDRYMSLGLPSKALAVAAQADLGPDFVTKAAAYLAKLYMDKGDREKALSIMRTYGLPGSVLKRKGTLDSLVDRLLSGPKVKVSEIPKTVTIGPLEFNLSEDKYTVLKDGKKVGSIPIPKNFGILPRKKQIDVLTKLSERFMKPEETKSASGGKLKMEGKYIKGRTFEDSYFVFRGSNNDEVIKVKASSILPISVQNRILNEDPTVVTPNEIIDQIIKMSSSSYEKLVNEVLPSLVKRASLENGFHKEAEWSWAEDEIPSVKTPKPSEGAIFSVDTEEIPKTESTSGPSVKVKQYFGRLPNKGVSEPSQTLNVQSSQNSLIKQKIDLLKKALEEERKKREDAEKELATMKEKVERKDKAEVIEELIEKLTSITEIDDEQKTKITELLNKFALPQLGILRQLFDIMAEKKETEKTDEVARKSLSPEPISLSVKQPPVSETPKVKKEASIPQIFISSDEGEFDIIEIARKSLER